MPSSGTFWDKIAEKYAASPIKDMESYEATLAQTRTHLTPEDRVLEVGCGTGTTALKLAPFVAHITATDISASMAEIGRGKAAADGVTNVDFIQGTLEEGNIPEGPFEAALAFNFLHLVEDLPGALGEIHKRIKPGGVFVSKTPCLGGRGVLARLMLPLILLFVRLRYFTQPPSVSFLNANELEDAMKAAGFEIVEAEGIPAGRPNHFVVTRRG